MSVNRRTCASVLRLTLGLIVSLSLGTLRCVSAQKNPKSDQHLQGRGQQVGNGKVELLHVAGNVYMIAGAGANITVQVGDENAIVVDAGFLQMSDEVLTAIRSVTEKPILFIIDTSADQDHVGGNGNLSKAGLALPDSSDSPRRQSDGSLPPGASIIAHINVLNRMSAPTGKEAAFPSVLWPTDTYDTDDWKLYNSESVFVYHPHNAHTDGDSYVLFRRSDVVSTGDILNLKSYPVIKTDQGGSINGLIDALNQIIDILEPARNEEGGTYVIPGHGRIGDRNDVANYRDMVTIIRGRIQYLMNNGMTIEQVKAAKTTLDYDGLYGATTGPWTTDMFVEAIYQELSKSTTQRAHKVDADR